LPDFALRLFFLPNDSFSKERTLSTAVASPSAISSPRSPQRDCEEVALGIGLHNFRIVPLRERPCARCLAVIHMHAPQEAREGDALVALETKDGTAACLIL
jgi:hypothetical protein